MVKLTCLASCTAVGLLLFVTEPALAEFQIQEAGIEKGEVETRISRRLSLGRAASDRHQ